MSEKEIAFKQYIEAYTKLNVQDKRKQFTISGVGGQNNIYIRHD